jgi:hypothetical protein
MCMATMMQQATQPCHCRTHARPSRCNASRNGYGDALWVVLSDKWTILLGIHKGANKWWIRHACERYSISTTKRQFAWLNPTNAFTTTCQSNLLFGRHYQLSWSLWGLADRFILPYGHYDPKIKVIYHWEDKRHFQSYRNATVTRFCTGTECSDNESGKNQWLHG